MKNRKRNKHFPIIGFLMFSQFIIILFLSAVGFEVYKLFTVFIHKNSVLAMLSGIIVAILVSGSSEIADAFKIAFLNKTPSNVDSLKESRRALVKAAKIIWLFAFACSAFNFIAGYRAVGGGGEPFLNATLAASYPLLYALLIANFIFMSMAAFIHKIIIDPAKEPVCLNCGTEIGESVLLVCPQCMEERGTKAASRGSKVFDHIYKIISILVRVAAFVLLALTFFHRYLTFYARYNISVSLFLYFPVMYFVSLASMGAKKSRMKAIMPALYILATAMAMTFGEMRFLAQSLWLSLLLIAFFSIPIGLIKPEIVLFGKRKSRILAVVIYVVLFILSLLPNMNPTVQKSNGKYAEWQGEAGEKFNQEVEIRNSQKDSQQK